MQQQQQAQMSEAQQNATTPKKTQHAMRRSYDAVKLKKI
jgi:hypothetical protein